MRLSRVALQRNFKGNINFLLCQCLTLLLFSCSCTNIPVGNIINYSSESDSLDKLLLSLCIIKLTVFLYNKKRRGLDIDDGLYDGTSHYNGQLNPND